MDKGDSTVIIEKNLPEAAFLESYYPAQRDSTEEKNLLHYAKMKKWEELWREHVPPHWSINTENARHFLFDMQYNKRKIGLIKDRDLFQEAKWLVRWMIKANHCPLILPTFDVEEGEDIEPRIRH